MSRRTPRRRSAQSVPLHTTAEDVPPPYVMKPTRLQDALENAHDRQRHNSLTEEPTQMEPPRHDARSLEQVYQRRTDARSSWIASSAYQSLPTLLSFDQERMAQTVLTAQLSILEHHVRHQLADETESIRHAMLTEMSLSSTSSDHLTRVPTASSAIAWYVIGKVIGKGTFGRVQRATHRVSGTRVAIKSYYRDKGASVCSPPPPFNHGSAPSKRTRSPPSEGDALEWKRVRHEAKLMASLHPHAGLIGFIEAFETPTQLQIVMEMVSGGSLVELLKQQPQQRLAEPTATRIFGQLCSAVRALHDQNVIHRDLKLENVLLDDQLQARLIDFGFSQREYATTEMGMSPSLPTARGIKNFCGTPSYMAPEVVACKSYDGKRVDVWSLGIILYVLLCGKFPFQATNLHQLYQTIRTTSLVFPATVSKDAQLLVRSLLVVDPLKRLSLAAIHDHAWMRMTIPNQVDSVVREQVFKSFLAWEHGVTMVCDTLGKLYGLDEATIAVVVRGGTHSHNSVAALVRLMMRVAAQPFDLAFEPFSGNASGLEDPGDVAVAVKKAAPASARQRPSPRSQIEIDHPTHKQQLEQLIGLVKQSLG